MRTFKPSPAMAVALFALIVAVGGTATAATYVITSSKQIKDGAVTSADVKNSSLTGADIKDKSLKAADFNGSVQGPTGPQGQQGERGVPGPIEGTPAGGALAGTYPNPRLADDSVQQSNLAPDALGTKITQTAGEACVPVRLGPTVPTLEATITGVYSTSGVLRCPIDVPTGATITIVRVRYHDNDPASDIQMDFGSWDFNASSFAELTLASFQTAGSSPSPATATLNWTFPAPPRATGDQAFNLSIEDTSNLRTILGFQVTYTL